MRLVTNHLRVLAPFHQVTFNNGKNYQQEIPSIDCQNLGQAFLKCYHQLKIHKGQVLQRPQKRLKCLRNYQALHNLEKKLRAQSLTSNLLEGEGFWIKEVVLKLQRCLTRRVETVQQLNRICICRQ